MTATTGRSAPRWARYKSSAAAATSVDTNGSMTISPVSPSTKLILEISNPRT
ncbi:Uncharacterised protein [Mycobacterium tuberculosis]|uniref:Uncharacterized protein n=1 Tax=Mycobacterium tuberculosis TaxID=1773 RepID=A0A916LA49_MYCTX|nr:Uncharacterised protein [Mycobacterium tuberculosis]COW70012.1 Uncharacterised protein [Mycobacterium tuberculosis]COX03771.1 Uncharacterised protein [Mycobacterium tuberculosis]COX73092.1 Uncharacterised protein [Mycobacterium tuberculosis]